MTSDRDLAGTVRSWLRADVPADVDRVLDTVLTRLDTTPQRRATWPAWRLPVMHSPVRVAIAAALIFIAAAVGIGIATAPRISTQPTPTPSASAPAPNLVDVPTGLLAPGRYVTDRLFPVSISLTLPAGYSHGRGGVSGIGLIHDTGTPGELSGVFFERVANVFADPCKGTLARPPVGPSVDDLVTALTSLPGVQAGPVTDVSIDGIPAKAFDLHDTLDRAQCAGDLHYWTYADTHALDTPGYGEHLRLYVLQVGAQRIVINTWYFASFDASGQQAAAHRAELQAIVDSMRIDKPS